MIFNALGFALTDKCPAECKMCCFSCNNKKSNVLDINVIKDVINQASLYKNITQLAVSGGEAFLYYDEMKVILEEAKKHDLWTTCSTNCYWCTDEDTTREKLLELKSLGLGGIRLSIDAMHQETVGIDKVRNLLNVAKELEIRCFINVGFTKSTKDETMKILESLNESLFYNDILFMPFLPIGKAKEAFDENDFYKLTHKYDLKCNYNHILAVMSNGDVFSCDSASMALTGLTMGNVYKDSLHDILKNIRHSPRHRILMTKGIQWFVNIIEEKKLFELADYYVNACQFCHDVFGNKEKYDILYPYIDEEIKKIKKISFDE